MLGKPEVRARVAEIMAVSAKGAVAATTARHRFIEASWARIELEVARCSVETAADLRALIEATVRVQQDVRVTEGGVSDRRATEVTASVREDAAASEMEAMLSALAARTRGDDDEPTTKH